jgi:hypothetical protein
VAWDFVELPSQIMENWCWEKAALDLFARHYQTAEPVPEALVERMKQGAHVPRGDDGRCDSSASRELDLSLHMELDLAERWRRGGPRARMLSEHSLPDPCPSDTRCWRASRTCSRSPVGYAAGYYSYKWAEVLEADAFGRFAHEGLFDANLGARLARGASSPAGTAKIRRAGARLPGARAQRIDALLERDGLLTGGRGLSVTIPVPNAPRYERGQKPPPPDEEEAREIARRAAAEATMRLDGRPPMRVIRVPRGCFASALLLGGLATCCGAALAWGLLGGGFDVVRDQTLAKIQMDLRNTATDQGSLETNRGALDQLEELRVARRVDWLAFLGADEPVDRREGRPRDHAGRARAPHAPRPGSRLPRRQHRSRRLPPTGDEAVRGFQLLTETIGCTVVPREVSAMAALSPPAASPMARIGRTPWDCSTCSARAAVR